MENKNSITNKFISIILLTVYFTSIKSLAYEKKDMILNYKIGINVSNQYLAGIGESKISDYFYEIIKFIESEMNIKFDIEVDSYSNNLKKIKNGDLDLLMGVPYIEKENNILYSQYYIGLNSQILYSKNDVKYDDLKNLKEINIAMVEDISSIEWLINYLQKENIKFNIRLVSNDNEAKKLMENNEANLLLLNTNDENYNQYNKLYEYDKCPIYIGANKKNYELMSKINDSLFNYIKSDKNSMEKMHVKNLKDTYIDLATYRKIIKFMASVTVILLSFIYLKNIYPNIIKFRIKHKIYMRIKRNQYILHYQPIVNPKLKNIIGFEALLRLNTKKGLIYPNEFLKEIEENKMLLNVSYWILKKVIEDYKVINEEMIDIFDKFYISINVSLNEIENEVFIENIIKMFNESNLRKESICLEITENVGIGDLEKLKIVLSKLKTCGFMIAIDDFGVEYSTLEILDKLDFDIIKLDKYFIDKIETSKFRKNAVDFISHFAVDSNKIIIAEGVESRTQKDIIEGYENEKFYIQGYFYSRPLSINKLKKHMKLICNK